MYDYDGPIRNYETVSNACVYYLYDTYSSFYDYMEFFNILIIRF